MKNGIIILDKSKIIIKNRRLNKTKDHFPVKIIKGKYEKWQFNNSQQ